MVRIIIKGGNCPLVDLLKFNCQRFFVLRPGEIDPDPETKPARPDPIDMDEDEKEMLSEARARLANTQGKKAKRKARERQLEEARRLAVLQKKRELKAAGIIMRHKTKKKGMDYNADIPFEKKPAPGFYDTSEEQARVAAAPMQRRLKEKKRQRKNGKEGEGPGHQTKFIPARDAQIQKLKEAESISRRRKLMLPSAKVGEAELEEIVKIGQAGKNAKALVGGGSDASGRLLSDYEGLENAWIARTPRTAPQEDNILSEARNLRNMSIAQTPLLGEENTPMHTNTGGGTGFESATPRHQVALTPNPLATLIRSGTGDVSATPCDMSVGSTPLRTPWRDNLSINPDGFPSIGDTPREQRLQAHSAKRALQTGFMNLPKPENNFELLVPEEENEGGDGEERGLLLSEEDAEERDAKSRRAHEEEEKRILSRRTQVVRLGLPLPANFDAATLLEHLSRYDNVEEGELGAAQKLGDAELASLIQHDSLEHPIPGTSRPGGAKSTYEIPNDESIHAAKSLIHLELASLVGFPEANVDQVREGLIALLKADSVDDHASWASPAIFRAAHRRVLSEHQNTMGQEAQKIAKHEKKLGKVLGGYQARSQAISKRVTDTFAELQTTYSNYQSFVRLQTNEAAVGPRRVDTLKEEVENLEWREKTLQERYAELAAEWKESEAKVTALEEKLMAEAEKFNEASLAEMEGVES
ncbi:pre-mRNA splicing factor component-domain-containing protein [Lentinula aff. lateritia]|uniref:Pre-mRNA splicing factor component-domain-containing protein n=1 Tax=Lentinula aff. lateritia TaxID=2804960 RepID=A0ACC1TLW5_9AGAR|nr:pre-mRNA splicing factor component-domain-containing protein [Lentinula aff. lateritia]